MKYHIAIGFVIASLHFTSFAKHYPEEFSDLFIERPKLIDITIVGSQRSEKIVAQSTHSHIRIEENSESYHKVTQYLLDNNIKSDYRKTLLNQLIQGVSTDPECQGSLAACVLTAPLTGAKYIFDFDNEALRLVVAADALDVPLNNIEYHSAYSTDNALINSSRLYGFSNLDQSNNITLANLTTVGMPLGHITLDTELKSSESEFELYTAMYDVDFKNYRLQAGRNRYNYSFNTTDLFNHDAKLNMDGVFIGSNRNLIKGSVESQQRIYFYSPQIGRVDVYRDERLIFTKLVNEGQQYVSYEELPKGVYDITLTVTAAGSMVLTDTRQVVNNNQYSLPTGHYDYVFGGGVLKGQEAFDDDKSQDEEADINIARGSIAYRLSDSVLIGSSITVSDQYEQLYQIGGRYFFKDKLGVDLVHGEFSSGGTHQRLNASYAPFFLDMRRLSTALNHDEETLSHRLYGGTDFVDIGLGLSGQVFGAMAFLRGNYYEYDYTNSITNTEYATDRFSVSTGLTQTFNLGTFGLNADYTITDKSDNDYRLSVSWSMPLGDKGVSTRMSLNTNQKDGFSRASNYLKAEHNFDDWYTNVEAGAHANSGREISSDISTSVAGGTDYMTASAYGYHNDQGDKSFSGTLTNTQIISTQGVSFTKNTSRSFALLSAQIEGNDAEDDLQHPIRIGISRNDKYASRNTLSSTKTKLIALADYQDYGFEFDPSGNNVELQKEKQHFFSHPGTMKTVDSKITKLESQLIILDDLYGNPISFVDCFGIGCISIEPISHDGVFRVNYKKNHPFKLISQQGECLINVPKDSSEHSNVIRGYCLPGVEKDQNKNLTKSLESGHIRSHLDIKDSVIFVDAVTLGQQTDILENTLNQYGIETKQVTVQDHVYFFITDTRLTSTQFEVLTQFNSYVITNGTESDVLTQLYDERNDNA